jgi:hypothetical protein
MSKQQILQTSCYSGLDFILTQYQEPIHFLTHFQSESKLSLPIMSRSEEVNIIATLTPKPENLERLKKGIRSMFGPTLNNEPGTLRYLMTEQIGAKEGELTKVIMVET